MKNFLFSSYLLLISVIAFTFSMQAKAQSTDFYEFTKGFFSQPKSYSVTNYVLPMLGNNGVTLFDIRYFRNGIVKKRNRFYGVFKARIREIVLRAHIGNFFAGGEDHALLREKQGVIEKRKYAKHRKDARLKPAKADKRAALARFYRVFRVARHKHGFANARRYRFAAEVEASLSLLHGKEHFKRELRTREFLRGGVLCLARAGVCYFYIVFRFCHSVFHGKYRLSYTYIKNRIFAVNIQYLVLFYHIFLQNTKGCIICSLILSSKEYKVLQTIFILEGIS